jgi:hypothetical protein
MSIGCGPCTDLAGILNYIKREGQAKPVNYVGFEINDIWTDVHNHLKKLTLEIYDNVNLRFIRGDAIKLVEKLDLSKISWRPNILILQYVLSDMVNNKENIHLFLDNIVTRLVPFMPVDSYILVNDINHYRARNYFDKLASSVSQSYKTLEYRAHFRNRNRKAYEYGQMQNSNEVTSQIPDDILAKYNPWAFCSSAQIVIKKKTPK